MKNPSTTVNAPLRWGPVANRIVVNDRLAFVPKYGRTKHQLLRGRYATYPLLPEWNKSIENGKNPSWRNIIIVGEIRLPYTFHQQKIYPSSLFLPPSHYLTKVKSRKALLVVYTLGHAEAISWPEVMPKKIVRFIP